MFENLCDAHIVRNAQRLGNAILDSAPSRGCESTCYPSPRINSGAFRKDFGNNSHSLESERCCRLIEELADVMDEPRQAELKEAKAIAANCREALAKKTEQCNELKREIKRIRIKYDVHEEDSTTPAKKKSGKKS